MKANEDINLNDIEQVNAGIEAVTKDIYATKDAMVDELNMRLNRYAPHDDSVKWLVEVTSVNIFVYLLDANGEKIHNANFNYRYQPAIGTLLEEQFTLSAISTPSVDFIDGCNITSNRVGGYQTSVFLTAYAVLVQDANVAFWLRFNFNRLNELCDKLHRLTEAKMKIYKKQ